MTIETYYYTFGYLVDIQKCLEVLGFTVDKLTPEIKQRIDDEFGPLDEDSSIEQWLEWWFELEMDRLHNNYVFKVDSTEYEVRRFTHDNKYNDKYYVVGVHMGEIDRFHGTSSMRQIAPLTRIDRLSQNSEWVKAIQVSSGNNVLLCNKTYYTIPHLKYEHLFISPSVYVTTNDCDCCS